MDKYSVEIIETTGTMNSPIFKKMAERGDITSTKIEEVVGSTVEIKGYAWCHITTDEKNFNMGYYSTNLGIISTGSEIFKDSVKDYLDEVKNFNIVKIKTKQGNTYKVSPVLENEDAE